MSIISDSLKRIKPSPTIAVTQKTKRRLRAAGKDVVDENQESQILILQPILKKQQLKQLMMGILNTLQLMEHQH